MNEKKCLSVYNELLKYLHEFELDWVVKQVKQAINEGKIRETKDYRGHYHEIIEEYTPQEQLILLIDAIQRAVVDTFEIGSEVYQFLKQESEATDIKREVTFISSGEEESKTSYFSESQLKEMFFYEEEIKQLKKDLVQLRSEVLEGVYK